MELRQSQEIIQERTYDEKLGAMAATAFCLSDNYQGSGWKSFISIQYSVISGNGRVTKYHSVISRPVMTETSLSCVASQVVHNYAKVGRYTLEDIGRHWIHTDSSLLGLAFVIEGGFSTFLTMKLFIPLGSFYC